MTISSIKQKIQKHHLLSKEEEINLFSIIETEEHRMVDMLSANDNYLVQFAYKLIEQLSSEEADRVQRADLTEMIELGDQSGLVYHLKSRRLPKMAMIEVLKESNHWPEWLCYTIRQSLEIIDSVTDKVFNSNIRLVLSLVYKHAWNRDDYSDLIQEGSMGLLRAIDRFDYKKGFRLSTYATFWIRQYIIRSATKMKNMVNVPGNVQENISEIHEAMQQFSLEDGKEMSALQASSYVDMEEKQKDQAILAMGIGFVSVDDHQIDLEDENNHYESWHRLKSMRYIIERCFEHMSKIDEEVIRMRYGIGFQDRFSLEEISKKVGLSSERVRQIELRAIRKMALRAGGLSIESIDDII